MSSQNCEIDSIFTLEYANEVPTLSKAARAGDLQTVHKLILEGSLPQRPDNRGWTTIHCCVHANQLEVLKLILQLKPKNKKYLVNLLTWENESPLNIALRCPRPSIDMVKLLLNSGADPNQATHLKITPLHLSCMPNGNLDLVKLLVQYGANVNAQEDIRFCTPLHFAIAQARNLEIIKYLIHLSDLTLINANDRCAFLEACSVNFLEAVKVFIEKDKRMANSNSPIPPLLYACIWGNIEMAKLLVESGADVHCKCNAAISSEPGESDFVFERQDFFPIHSSLNSMEVFTYLLKLTQPEKLLKLENRYYTFPLYVLLFSSSSSFYEALLQSNYPVELKAINCRVLVNFALSYPFDMDHYILRSFTLLFKYNFHFEPENVFSNFACQLSVEEVCFLFNIFYILSQMGISSEDEFENKRMIIRTFRNFIEMNSNFEDLNTVRSVCDLLAEPVLTLKQYCRIAVRRKIKSEVGDDWLAYKMINESGLPDCLKKFLFFEILK